MKAGFPQSAARRGLFTSGLAAGLVGLTGCAVYRGELPAGPTVSVPSAFSATNEAAIPVDRWWTEFESAELNGLVDAVITNNLSLRQAWARLAQAEALATIQGAERFPQVSFDGSAGRTRVDGTTSGSPSAMPGTFERYVVGGGLSYEIDLWRRVASQRASALRGLDATRADTEAAALSLAGQAANLWIAQREQAALQALLDKQIESSRTILELLELRFQVSQATALDVYQQRQQLAATEAQVPLALSALTTLRHQLAVLQGLPPTGPTTAALNPVLPDLPAAPPVDTPEALLTHRPDLRSAWHRLEAADRDVAAAVADRYPRIQLNLGLEYSAAELSDVLDNETQSLLGGLVLPLVDGGRRRAVVDQRRAVVAERLAAFNLAFLTAVREVEDALVRERFQAQRVEKVLAQEDAARANFNEAQARYRNGLIDYLPVITALQSLQVVERNVVSVRAELLQNRIQLYTALGGRWTADLQSQDLAAVGHSKEGNHR